MKKQITATLIAIAAAASLSTAFAAQDQFNKLDADGDGYISAQEAVDHEGLQKGWQSTDANMDGKVDAAEFSAFEMQAQEQKAPEGK